MTTLTLDLSGVLSATVTFRGELVADAKRFEDGLPAPVIALNAGTGLKLTAVAAKGGDFAAALARAGGLFVVMANALPERAEAFRRFYVERHMDDMLRLDGVLSALLLENQGEGHQFISLFPLSDCRATQQALAAVRGTPQFPPNPETDRAASRPGFYEARR